MSSPSLSATHPRLVAYLRQATWAVPSDDRAEVWAELEDHVLTRTRQLEVLGLAPEAALQQALAELGNASRVGVGIGRIFHGPKVLALGAALILISALHAALPRPATLAVVPAYPRMMAELSPKKRLLCLPITLGGSRRDCYPTVVSAIRPLQVNLQAIRSALSRQGVPTALDAKGRLSARWYGQELTLPAWAFTHGVPYGSAADLTLALLQSEPSLVLTSSGGTPGVKAGELGLQFGQEGWTAEVRHYYDALAPALLERLWPDQQFGTGRAQSVAGSSSTWKTGLREGTVVMLVMPPTGGLYRTDFAVVGAGGELSLSVPRDIRFAAWPDELNAQATAPTALLVPVSDVPLTDLPGAVLTPQALH